MEKRTRLFRELSAEGQGQAELESHLAKSIRTKGRDGATEEDQERTQGHQKVRASVGQGRVWEKPELGLWFQET